ncbi:MAG: tRNA (adenosine(37)-N6)-threonylcarbamoyltransferase complex ATPase subunit type 1 TsaE [Endomicrobium sp.]|jgi:tRNA threonylcarbamoyladenosine biosynthesis protein TsaE|nr:tRNA (adenosine(37)-N6)-threonylcarbamoyltransferase complex ATPase subunit type 1 TsaE [Endomicrobium sp.]
MVKNKKSNIPDTGIFNENIFFTKTPQETRNLGKKFASLLKSGDIVFLKGDLGSGKTTFVQGVVKSFCNKDFARSSSFTLVNEYDTIKLKLFHIDLYRLNPSVVWDVGIEEYLYSKNISIVEWSDRLRGAENDNNWDIEIKNIDSKRKIKIENKNENFSYRNLWRNI